MITKGNFYSLMFFVLALGVLVCYFVMGWSTNLISQVRPSRQIATPAGLLIIHC